MFKCLLVIATFILSAFAQNTTTKNQWLTLNGQEPIVIARGGLSGLFPESSSFANQISTVLSLSNSVLFCNLQLTKDGIGICLSDLRLQNSTIIEEVFPKASKQYRVNGELLQGWFGVDYNSQDLFESVTLIQSTYSRPSLFDASLPIAAVEDVVGLKPYQFWLNIRYEAFYHEHNLSVASYVQKAMRLLRINYLSSPEIGLLKTVAASVNKARTKLIFQFLGADTIEPTTRQTYGALVKDLAMIKSIASGILIPKEYIWPVGPDRYLLPSTTLVDDAHKLGLEVYASGFANDLIASYNYSSDPVQEYLQFIDNGKFSVDGVLTDFSPTASEAIACFSSINNDGKPRLGTSQALVITSNGASGDYPGSSDLAYQYAVESGADVIDCSVQLSKDGVAFCLDKTDLLPYTSAISSFSAKTSTVPELQIPAGIFSFDLTWSEIQTLKPAMANPFIFVRMARNPAYKNMGKLVTLSEFLEFAKAKAVTGIMINIENAAYLASKKGLDIIGAVTTALSNATLDKQSTQRIFIRSDAIPVLSKFQASFPTYTRVFTIVENIGRATQESVEEIKKHADAVAVSRTSIITSTESFTTGLTKVVEEMKAVNLSVYVYVMRNEFISMAFDFFSDPTVEIATYVDAIGVDGIITEFPKTASNYMKCPCRFTEKKDKSRYTILPPEIGSMIDLVPKEIQPPAEAPKPQLDFADVVDPPLPPVANVSSTTSADGPAPSPSAASSNLANLFVSSIVSLMLLTIVSSTILP